MNFSRLGVLKSVFKDLPSLGPTTLDTFSLPSGNRLSQMLNSRCCMEMISIYQW